MRPKVLVSVTDKRNLGALVPLARNDWEFISTGGTAKELRTLGVVVTEVSDYTGFPEMLDGRLKTLHPKIFGGILPDLRVPKHRAEIAEHRIEPITLVVVNLYDFAKRPNINEIDIGGPSLLRAAAKNGATAVPIVDPDDYERVVSELLSTGVLSLVTRGGLASKVFWATAAYDAMISQWFMEELAAGRNPLNTLPAGH
ncbi:MAG: IMP cyclohydrolase [Patescibacteria group bacterium]